MTLSNQILDVLYRARPQTLDDVCDALGVNTTVQRDGVRPRRARREDVRTTIRRLDDAGLVDASRMRLTLHGFAMAIALRPPRLRLVRTRSAA